MKIWLRRLLYLLILILWFIGMSLPIVMFALGARGQLQLGTPEANHIRLFLVREEESEGVGLEWARNSAQTNCTQTTVSYWLWEGDSQDTIHYCTCATGDCMSGNSTTNENP